MLILVVLFMFGIYYIAPHDAHLSYKTDKIVFPEKISAGYMRLDSPSNIANISLYHYTEMHFLGTAFINDETFYVDHKIIEPPEEFPCDFIIYPTDGYGTLQMQIEPPYEDYVKEPSFLFVTGRKINEPKMWSTEGIAEIMLDNHFIDIDVLGYIYVSTSSTGSLDTGPLRISFDHCDVFFRDGKGNTIQVTEQINLYSNSISFPQGVSISSAPNASISVERINTFVSQGGGEVNFSYSPSSVQYFLNNQKLELHSKDSLLQMSIEYDNHYLRSVDVNGMVSKAYISGMNLFPDFYGWFRSNSYMAPIALLTVVYGGVTIMLNNRKKVS